MMMIDGRDDDHSSGARGRASLLLVPVPVTGTVSVPVQTK